MRIIAAVLAIAVAVMLAAESHVYLYYLIGLTYVFAIIGVGLNHLRCIRAIGQRRK